MLKIGEMSFRTLKLGKLGEISFGMLKLNELSFEILKLGEVSTIIMIFAFFSVIPEEVQVWSKDEFWKCLSNRV